MVEASAPEPIAIVGIGCRLPGGADDPDALWQRLTEGFDAIGPIPADRFDVGALYDPRPATPGRIMTQWGGFLADVEWFDAELFGIAPREAEHLDPQQRLVLETAWEALEDAGTPTDRLAGSRTGVFVGIWIDDFEARLFADPDSIDFHMTTGSGRYAASGRLSYVLDLIGPSITVDTACSSSLVAVHLASQSLRTGECDVALAGGANVILEPSITIAYSQSRMMAPDGRCKFGDASADGYVRSDGAAMVVLKRLSSAVADGDHVYAIIRGSAVTNDGRSSGFLATPGQAGQEEMLRQAYAHAGVDPASVQYIEAHGTGTAAGDPVELGALGAVVGDGRAADRPCLVGSVKTNVGHTEGAAGVAGLVKVALALEHREIPASLQVRQPNPAVPWRDLRLEVCATRRPWPASDGPARAGVSAFGIAGTNAHIVLEEAPAMPAAAPVTACGEGLLLALSAQGPKALSALVDSYQAQLASDPGTAAAVCAAAAQRRGHHRHRLAITARDGDDLVEALTAQQRGEARANIAAHRTPSERPRVVFVFPGQGSQWPGMARELLGAEPAFRAAIEACDRAIRAEAGWSPVNVLSGTTDVDLDAIDVVQPLLFAVEVALAAQWRAWGIEPDGVVGHSMGEVAAAHVAGALDLDDAVAVICRRSALLMRVRGQGAMAVVDLPADEARAAIAGHERDVAIAVSNSARSTVISGAPAAIDAVLERLQRTDVFCRPVKVDVASHSPQMEPLVDDLRRALAGLTPHAGSVPFLSTVEGRVVDGVALDAEYWARNLRQPVLFSAAVDELARPGPTLFVEISPHPILLPAIEQTLHDGGHDGVAIGSLRRDEPERLTLLGGLGRSYVAGATPAWSVVFGGCNPTVRLPTYPWQRERFWPAPSAAKEPRRGHPLLGVGLRPVTDPRSWHWQTTLTGGDLAFLTDHVVHGTAILPAAGFVMLARAAAAEAGLGTVQLAQLHIHEALVLDAWPVQVTLDRTGVDAARLRVFAVADADDPVLHAEVMMVRAPAPEPGMVAVDAVQARCTVRRDELGHVRAMTARGLDYGPTFRTVGDTWLGEGEALGRLRVPPGAVGPLARGIVLLDGALQVALDALPAGAGQRVLPVHVEHVVVHRDAVGDELWAHAAVTASRGDETSVDVTVVDDDGVLADVRGVRFRRVDDGARRVDDLFYELQWQPAEVPPASPTEAGTWVVYAGHEIGADLVARLRAAGDECVVVPDSDHGDATSVAEHLAILERALDRADAPGRGVVYAWATDVPAEGPGVVAAAERLGGLAPLALVQALSVRAASGSPIPRLWLLTRGSQAVDEGSIMAAGQAVLWGMGRSAAREHPSLRVTLVDVDPGAVDDAALFAEVRADAPDPEVGLRGTHRSVSRLERAPQRAARITRWAAVDAYRLVAGVGSLDALALRPAERRRPGPGEIELRVDSSALNFLDVLKAMGIYPGLEPGTEAALGAECAGTVVAVGEGVEGFAVGDEVVAITPSYRHTSLLASHATVPASFAVRRPPGLAPEVASALPIAYLTAHYALVELARVQPGARVLVHSATGGVGLAALEVCRLAGADVIATAGTAAKRDHLRSLGVTHVFDSRSLAFADEVLAVTDGRGVDVVLNSLAGEAIPAGLAVLAPRGRFVELGKRDVYGHGRLDLRTLTHNRSLFVVDLASLTEEDPAYVAGLFHEIMAMVVDGRLGPLPVTVAPITDAAGAFRTMAQAGHIGKLVLEAAPVPLLVDTGPLRPDGTYLLTGGLGALGLAAAGRLVERGARHLALLGRSAPSVEAAEAVADLRAQGADVRIVPGDVTDAAELGAALAAIRAAMPPIRGVFHAAGTLADATIDRLDADRFRAALAPKLGAFHVHEATRDDPLDHFVAYSSVAGVLGLAGQANYAAGNAFLDALAHQRRRAGRPALSIDWGPWSTIGLATDGTGRGDRLAERGLGGLAPHDALDALDRLLDGDRTQVVVMHLDAERWLAAEPESGRLLAPLATATGAHGPAAEGLRDRIAAARPGVRRQRVVEDAVCAELAPVLRLNADRIDRHLELKAMGLDSLMALELRNRLEVETGLQLPATVVWNHPTVALLSTHLAERMGVALDAAEPAATAVPPAGPSAGNDETSDELEALLAEELAAVDRLLEADRRAL